MSASSQEATSGTQADVFTMKHLIVLGDGELAATRHVPRDLDGELSIKHRRPNDELVFLGHRDSFLLLADIAASAAITGGYWERLEVVSVLVRGYAGTMSVRENR